MEVDGAKNQEKWKDRQEDDESFRREFTILLKELRSHTVSNLEYFKDGDTEKYNRLETAFRTLFDHLDRGIEPGIEKLITICHEYDFDENLPANGYRSFVRIIRKCCFKILQISRHISANRDSFLFRGGHYGRELTAYVTTLGQLRACMHYLTKLRIYCGKGALFVAEDMMTEAEFAQAESLMLDVESLSQECFYGRCLGFQYCDSMARPLTGICLFMASFSDGYLSENSSTVMRFANSVVGGGRYLIDPELRGEKIVEVTRNCDIKFCKAFWAMNENDVMHTLPLFVCPPVQLDRVITLPPETIEMPLADSEDVIKVNPPSAHHPPSPVSCRLISYELREGQDTWKAHGAVPSHANPTKVLPRASGLVIHIHGGGFVAQSSASHEVYLRHWAKQLHVPLLSIDYGLAPDNPFPRGLEDCFYAYCWAVKNCRTLGSTGERIAVVGDSAGGNLAISLAMRAAAFGIRIPDGVQTTYACMMVRYSPSPSRIMSLMDPLLPMGIISRCLAAYAGMTEATGVNAPMRTSITKQTLYEYEEKTMSAANSLENLDSISTSNVDPHTTMKHSADNDANSVKSSENYDINNQSKSTSEQSQIESESIVIKSKRSKLSDTKHVSFEDEILPQSSHMNDKDNKLTNSMDSGFMESEKHNGGTEGTSDSKGNSSDDVTSDEGRGESPHEIFSDASQETPLSSPSDIPHSILQEKTTQDISQNNELTNKNLRDKLELNFDKLRLRKNADKKIYKSPSSPSFPHSATGHMPPSKFLSPNHASPSQYYTPLSPQGEISFAKIRHYAQSPMMQFKNMPADISRNPYMSPILASDELISRLPPIYFVCCHLDPMLDDSITLAKRLRDLGNEVHLDVLEDLPHGYLNFILVSKEAKQGSDLCVRRIMDILEGPPDYMDEEDESLDEESVVNSGFEKWAALP